eukprot:CAMPEP_0197915808 /NCGR_PEP_ID=MMETSP1439-20131203/80855_1 /TAXON_ID=66791 /ORGANISM="Gonyaulax spinifera, Strain CCMP409" /LENGTH=90 /DNA_ID=CAMNT_0043537787 /DNA_START=66 /DNA_END=335 /DNA_ORIENTATION=+
MAPKAGSKRAAQEATEPAVKKSRANHILQAVEVALGQASFLPESSSPPTSRSALCSEFASTEYVFMCCQTGGVRSSPLHVSGGGFGLPAG